MTGMRASAGAVLVTLALVAAGCGGDDEVPAATQWAGDLCAAVTTLRDSITATAETLTENPTREGFESAAEDARSATETFIDTVRGLGAPETESGDEAQEAVESLADTLESDAARIEETLEDLSGAEGVLGAISSVATIVASMASTVSSSLDEVRSLGDVDNELEQAFRDAEACDDVVRSGS